MKTKKFIASALALTFGAILLGGCGQTAPAPPPAPPAPAPGPAEPAPPPEPPPADQQIVIGYVINNFGDTFQNFIFAAAENWASANNVQIINADAQESTVRQQDEVNNLIVRGVDALVVVPVDTAAMEPITQAALNAGIPLVYVNRNPFAGREDQMPDGVFYVGSQEIEAGIMQMEHVGNLIGGEGGVAILQGILANEGAIMRTEGNERVAEEQFPNINILARETGNWQTDQAVNITENWITAFGDNLNAVLANNDDMAIGAIRALEMAGRGDVLVMGIDGNPNALDEIERGTLAGSVFQDAVGQGEGAVSMAFNAVRGVSQDSVTWIPFQLITIDNVANFR